MRKFYVIAFLVLCSCVNVDTTGDDQSSPQDGGEVQWLYRCYTHATCDGDTVDQVHDICVRPSAQDVLEPGDHEARNWGYVWSAACSQYEGIVADTSDHRIGQECVANDGHASTWGCSQECIPQFTACE